MHVHTNMEGHCNPSVLVLLAVPQNRVGYHEALTKLEPRWVSDVCAVLKIGNCINYQGFLPLHTACWRHMSHKILHFKWKEDTTRSTESQGLFHVNKTHKHIEWYIHVTPPIKEIV